MISSGRCHSPLIILGRCPCLQPRLSFALANHHLRNSCVPVRTARSGRRALPSRSGGLGAGHSIPMYYNRGSLIVEVVTHIGSILSKNLAPTLKVSVGVE